MKLENYYGLKFTLKVKNVYAKVKQELFDATNDALRFRHSDGI